MRDSKGRFGVGSVCWKKGTKKIQDPNEIRQCKECGEKKIVTTFIKGAGDLYRYKCKECGNKKNRTGKPNEGRFKPGHDKGKRFEKGHIPWHAGTKGQSLTVPQYVKEKEGRHKSWKYNRWREAVKQRDEYKCVECGSKNRIAAHHIKPWKEDETLRFSLENGKTLCASCHGKLEGFQKGHKMPEQDKFKSGNTKLIRFLEGLIKDSYGDK